MYTYQGNLYLKINKDRFSSLDTEAEIITQIKILLRNLKCFFFYEVERRNELLSATNQTILALTRTDQIVYGKTIYGGEPNLDTASRMYQSDPTDTFTLEQTDSTVELDLKLRNQF